MGKEKDRCGTRIWLRSAGVIPLNGIPNACGTCPGFPYFMRRKCNVIKIAIGIEKDEKNLEQVQQTLDQYKPNINQNKLD